MLYRTPIMSIFAAILLLAVAQCAFAQSTSSIYGNGSFSARIGLFVPDDANNRQAGGTDQISGGIDYALSTVTNSTRVVPSVYVDYQGGARNGAHLQTYALGLSVRTHSGNRHGVSPYVGAGIAATYSDYKASSTFSSSTETGVGAKFFGGLEWASGYFGEIYTNDSSTVGGVNPGGYGVQLGIRF